MVTTLEDDTIRTQVVPVDLYSLIYPVKEQQFKDFGRVLDYGYEEKMLALLDGKPLIRLQRDRISREVVRVILTKKDSIDFPIWACLEGTGRGVITYGATEFPNVSDEELRDRLHALTQEGLLDVMFGRCGSSGLWCFESEIVYYQEEVSHESMGRPVTHNYAKFVANTPLRDALVVMLKPFEAEKPRYDHFKRERSIR